MARAYGAMPTDENADRRYATLKVIPLEKNPA